MSLKQMHRTSYTTDSNSDWYLKCNQKLSVLNYVLLYGQFTCVCYGIKLDFEKSSHNVHWKIYRGRMTTLLNEASHIKRLNPNLLQNHAVWKITFQYAQNLNVIIIKYAIIHNNDAKYWAQTPKMTKKWRIIHFWRWCESSMYAMHMLYIIYIFISCHLTNPNEKYINKKPRKLVHYA